MPPNKGMELTGKSDTPFAKRRAKGAPLLPTAHPRRYTARIEQQSSGSRRIRTFGKRDDAARGPSRMADLAERRPVESPVAPYDMRGVRRH
jgi:hypothetical protein